MPTVQKGIYYLLFTCAEMIQVVHVCTRESRKVVCHGTVSLVLHTKLYAQEFLIPTQSFFAKHLSIDVKVNAVHTHLKQ